jgi:hypothetical protein
MPALQSRMADIQSKKYKENKLRVLRKENNIG